MQGWNTFRLLAKVSNLRSCMVVYKSFTFETAVTDIRYPLFYRCTYHNGLISTLPFTTQMNNFPVFSPGDVVKLGYYDIWRSFSKRRKKKRSVTVDKMEESSDESDSDEVESDDELIDEYDEGVKLITKSVPTLRLDSILKLGLKISKKTVEKKFYVFKIRLNGEKVLKKSVLVEAGDEIDEIKGYCPENTKNLVVNRVVVRSIGDVTVAATYPIKLHVYKSLIIENYEDKWHSGGEETF